MIIQEFIYISLNHLKEIGANEFRFQQKLTLSMLEKIMMLSEAQKHNFFKIWAGAE